ncbi:MAG: sigma factor [Oscillospiraceae bacterium]
MTNEELAVMIQGGRADLAPTLWKQVERFVAKQAHRWFLNNRRRVEFDDLDQSGFLAMMEAVRTFDPEGGSSSPELDGEQPPENCLYGSFGRQDRKTASRPAAHCRKSRRSLTSG